MKENSSNILLSRPIDTENLIVRMQKEDKRNKRIMYVMFFVYLAFSLIYFFMFVINPDPVLPLIHRFAGILFVVAFIIGTIFLWYRYKKFKKIDYTLPLVQVLENTVERYRYWGKKWMPVLIIVALVDIGFTISYYTRFEYWAAGFWVKILSIQAFYWGVMLAGGIIGYLIWLKRSRPIWRDAKTLLEDLKN
jgi:hypothetical protein